MAATADSVIQQVSAHLQRKTTFTAEDVKTAIEFYGDLVKADKIREQRPTGLIYWVPTPSNAAELEAWHIRREEVWEQNKRRAQAAEPAEKSAEVPPPP
jgi:hypothetical protein